jgi:hypothetical protein
LIKQVADTFNVSDTPDAPTRYDDMSVDEMKSLVMQRASEPVQITADEAGVNLDKGMYAPQEKQKLFDDIVKPKIDAVGSVGPDETLVFFNGKMEKGQYVNTDIKEIWHYPVDDGFQVAKVKTESLQSTNSADKDSVGYRLLGDVQQEQALQVQARKYKSAEEFVKAQGEPVYRAGEPFDRSKFTDFGMSVGRKKSTAEIFGGKTRGMEELNISKDAKVLKELPPSIKVDENFDENIVKYARENGYDVVDISSHGIDELRVLNPDVVKTKSQLTDLYHQATEEVKTVITPKTKESHIFDGLVNNIQTGNKGIRINDLNSVDFKSFTDTTKTKEGRATVDHIKKLISDGKKPGIEIKVDKNGKTFVEDGHHTVQAYKELGFDNIPIKTLKGFSTKKAIAAGLGVTTLASGAVIANQKHNYNEDGTKKSTETASAQTESVTGVKDDKKEVVNTIFSEAGNNKEEYAAMYQAIKNRAQKLKEQTGKEWTLSQVLSIPRQYQGREDNMLFKRAQEGKLNVLEQKKLNDISKSINQSSNIGKHDSFGDLQTLKRYAPKAYKSGDYKKVGSHYFFTMESNFKTR